MHSGEYQKPGFACNHELPDDVFAYLYDLRVKVETSKVSLRVNLIPDMGSFCRSPFFANVAAMTPTLFSLAFRPSLDDMISASGTLTH